jgi:hypothetical protein
MAIRAVESNYTVVLKLLQIKYSLTGVFLSFVAATVSENESAYAKPFSIRLREIMAALPIGRALSEV